MYDILELSKKLLPELKDIAKELKIKKTESLKKQDLIYKILDQQAVESVDLQSGAGQETIPEPESEGIFSVQEQSSGDTTPAQDSASPYETSVPDSDSYLRRGKRPRTSKQVVTRPVESVMSVSPDDLKAPDTAPSAWKDRSSRQEKATDSTEPFRSND